MGICRNAFWNYSRLGSNRLVRSPCSGRFLARTQVVSYCTEIKRIRELMHGNTLFQFGSHIIDIYSETCFAIDYYLNLFQQNFL